MKAMLLIESEYVARILSWGGGGEGLQISA